MVLSWTTNDRTAQMTKRNLARHAAHSTRHRTVPWDRHLQHDDGMCRPAAGHYGNRLRCRFAPPFSHFVPIYSPIPYCVSDVMMRRSEPLRKVTIAGPGLLTISLDGGKTWWGDPAGKGREYLCRNRVSLFSLVEVVLDRRPYIAEETGQLRRAGQCCHQPISLADSILRRKSR